MITIENPQTGETRELESNENFKLPWRVKDPDISGERMGQIVEHQKQMQVVGVNVDDRLNKIAAMLFIPAADVVKTVGTALGLHCATCQLRFEIWKKAQELGWWKVVWLTAKSIKAQIQHDEAAIKEMAKELEQ